MTTCVLGYEPTERGREALLLAINLARLTKADLQLVYVIEREPESSVIVPDPSPDYWQLLEGQAKEWLQDAVAAVPPEVKATSVIRYSYDVASGLLAAVAATDAGFLVVGAARQSLLNRYAIGSVADTLLHSSPVPVALAPNGYHGGGIERVTCAIGTRPGWEALLSAAIRWTGIGGVPLRLLTLTSLQGAERATGSGGTPGSGGNGESHTRRIEERAARELPESARITTVSAEGATIEEAVQRAEWLRNEVVLVGSSRLAQAKRIFLGNTASHMLKALTVPMVVVPNQGEAPEAPAEGSKS